jgi:hypothetical protein
MSAASLADDRQRTNAPVVIADTVTARIDAV